MANTVKVKMKCVSLSPAGGGQVERVVLEQVSDNDTSKDNGDVANANRFRRVMARTRLEFADKSTAAGQFIKDQAYVVSFAETT